MFTAATVRNGSSYLGKHLCANDYYCKEETVIGVWVGEGARLLGLEGRTIAPGDRAFERLRLNQHPETGLPLTPRTKEGRIAFYDFQISAPKSVSIVAMTAGDTRLIAAHEECATHAFRLALETVAARQDHSADIPGMGTAGQGFKTTGNLVAARFTHHASRELDAQLHCHFVCVNATFDPVANRWFALANHQMFEVVNLAGRLYQNELAKEVTRLGYRTLQDRDSQGIVRGFEIVGAQSYDFTLTPAHLLAQSTRRQQIEAAIEVFTKEKGYAPSSAEIQVIARQTREKSLPEISTAEVIAGQRAKYSKEDQHHFREMVAAAEVAHALPSPPAPENPALTASLNHKAVTQGLSHCLERHSVTTQKDVLAYALAEYVGQVDYLKLLAEVQRAAPVLEDKGTPLTVITSAQHLDTEKRMVQIVADGRGKFEPLSPGYEVEGAGVGAGEAGGLGEDQKAAVLKILESRDLVVALRGPAGTGKTTTLKTLDQAFHNSLVAGFRSSQLEPVYLTPRHSAREVLIADGFTQAETIAATLPKIEKGELDLRGKILVVDEAGLLSSADMARTLVAAKKANARVLLVGDEKQLSSVDAGDALAILRRHSPLQVVELTQIRRQEPAGYRAAMHAMAQGKVGEGLAQLDEIELIKESGPAYLAEAARAYQERAQRGENVLLVSPTWAEIHQLNDLIRTGHKAAGLLQGPAAEVAVFQSVNLTKAQRENILQYREGMALTVTGPLPGFVQGETHSIKSVDTEAGRIKLENGKELAVERHAASLDLGSWRTIEVAQGDKIIFQRSDRKHGLSAGKLATVEKVGSKGELTVSFAGKAKLFSVPTAFRSYAHGYAITADKSQGKTTTHVIVAGQSLDAKRLYVATSRGRKTLELHVPSKERLFAKTPQTIKNRPAALDYLAQKTQKENPLERPSAFLPSPASHLSRLSQLKTFAEKARHHFRLFRVFAERLLRGETKEKQQQEHARGQKAQQARERLILAQKHAHTQRHHARENPSRSLGHGR